MSGWKLTLRREPAAPIDMAPLTPAALAGLTAAEAGALTVRVGRERVSVDTLFRLARSDRHDLQINRASPLMANVGAGLESGTLHVSGTVGDNAGAGMRGGRLQIRGSAGALCGAGMSGGHIEVTGDAGSHLGAGLPGSLTGMTGGSVHVRGSAGERLGERMRRGSILVEGDVGAFCGASMIAGTIIVLGNCGRGCGVRMRRGTIIVTMKPGGLGSGFGSSGRLQLPFLRLLSRRLARVFEAVPTLKHLPAEGERIAGDFAVGGQGEILVLDAPETH